MSPFTQASPDASPQESRSCWTPGAWVERVCPQRTGPCPVGICAAYRAGVQETWQLVMAALRARGCWLDIEREEDTLVITAKGRSERYITLDDSGCATLDQSEHFGGDVTAAINSLADDPAERVDQVRRIAIWL